MLSLKDFPFILRAKEYYLYDEKGKRYLDLYVGGGRYALGHRLPHRLQMIKNILSKGLFSHYPHDSFFEKRILKVCEQYFSQNIQVWLFRKNSSWSKFQEENITSQSSQEIWDEGEGDFIKLRPFQKKELKNNIFYSLQVPLPSFIGEVEIVIQKTQGSSLLHFSFEEWDFFSQKVLENSLYNLMREEKKKLFPIKKVDFTQIGKQEDFYLIPTYGKENHDVIFFILKEEGILISPLYEDPIFLNPFLKESDLKLIKKAILRLKEKT